MEPAESSLMLEPVACLACPQCLAATVIALRTAEMRNVCHCSTCGHVWNDEDPPQAPASDAELRPKPDRRRVSPQGGEHPST